MNNIYLNIDFELFEKQRASFDKSMMRMCQKDWKEYDDLVCLRAILDSIHSQLRSFNRVKTITFDQDLERHELCGIPIIKYSGGIQRFEYLTADSLGKLITKGYINPEDTQNDSPSVGEFYEYAKTHPTIKFHFLGYVVSPEREDCRVSIEGFTAWAGSREDVRDLLTFAKSADEIDELEPYVVKAWWD